MARIRLEIVKDGEVGNLLIFQKDKCSPSPGSTLQGTCPRLTCRAQGKAAKPIEESTMEKKCTQKMETFRVSEQNLAWHKLLQL